MGFLSRIRESHQPVQPGSDAAQASVWYDELVHTKENIQSAMPLMYKAQLVKALCTRKAAGYQLPACRSGA